MSRVPQTDHNYLSSTSFSPLIGCPLIHEYSTNSLLCALCFSTAPVYLTEILIVYKSTRHLRSSSDTSFFVLPLCARTRLVRDDLFLMLHRLPLKCCFTSTETVGLLGTGPSTWNHGPIYRPMPGTVSLAQLLRSSNTHTHLSDLTSSRYHIDSVSVCTRARAAVRTSVRACVLGGGVRGGGGARAQRGSLL